MDSVVLFGLIMLVASTYIGRLGFDSDDWAFLAYLHTGDRSSPISLVHALWSRDPVLHQRPVQIGYLAGLYWVAGDSPLCFHVVNTVVEGMSTVLLFLILMRVAVARRVAFAIAAVYGLLPQYSTDRFWVAAHQATLGVFFMLLSIYFDLRVLLGGKSSRTYVAKLVATVAFLLAALAYEVVIPLLAATTVVVWLYARGRTTPRIQARLVIPNVIGLALLVFYKLLTTVQLGVHGSYAAHLQHLVFGSLKMNFGKYGVGYPFVVRWIVDHHFDPAVTVIACVAGLTVAWRLLKPDTAVLHQHQARPRLLILGGLLVFALGYAIFIGNSQSLWFTSTALGNRTAIVAAIGVAFVYVGAASGISNFLPLGSRRYFFAGSIGVLVAVGALIIGTLGDDWASAYAQQQRIVMTVKAAEPTLPARTQLVLDGICLDNGTAFTFTGARDFGSRLQLEYGDRTLWGSVIRYPPVLQRDQMLIYTFGPQPFPYSSHLLVFDYSLRRTVTLETRNAAQKYFRSSEFHPTACASPEWGLERGWKGWLRF